MLRAKPLSPQHFLFLFVPRDKCFRKTFLWSPGMKQIKPNLSPHSPCPSLFPAAPHTLNLTGSPAVSLSGTPHLAEAIFTVRGLREMRLGRTSNKVRAVPTGSSDSGPQGGVWGFWEPRRSWVGPTKGSREKSLFSLYKKLGSICTTGSGL